MLHPDLVIAICLAYVAILFAVAFAGDRRARRDSGGWLSSPLVYTLSISIYCSSWTFFGAVGSAARNGLEFIAIYLGPTIVFVGWWVFLRKLVTVGRVHNTTSIADFISARYGKSQTLGAVVTLIAVIATAPYISLQLKALTDSFQVLTLPRGAVTAASSTIEPDYVLAFWIAAGLCVFSIIFGVRNIDVNERHHGVVAAIAVEAVVKLVALLAVGLWVVGLSDWDPALVFAGAPASIIDPAETFGPRWLTLLFLAAAAVICLPRQFQVTVVENSDNRQIRTASWLFPLYLLLLCLFVIPIAIAGLERLPAGSNPDLFVLTLPMQENYNTLTLLAFLGGFSSATSMVIVSSIALSTMISNHIVMPLALRLSLLPQAGAEAMRHFILTTRRCAVVFVVLLGLIYLRASNSDALAAIGLISFCGVAQFLPSLVGGLYWSRATAAGALVGLVCGLVLWGYTLVLPSFGGTALMSASTIADGPFGVLWLRPHALFGLNGYDPLVHAVFWSMTANVLLFVLVSLAREPTPLARFQSMLFVDVFRRQTETEQRIIRRTARIADLRQIAERILGPAEATALFADREVRRSIIAGDNMISRVEQRLAANVGAASARSLISRVVSDETISVQELKRLAGEAEQIRAYSEELERKSRQVEATAAALAAANQRLREVDAQKDEFLSQISHEVRTPMTSIRSFSDILLAEPAMQEEQKLRFLNIIQNESSRLTRLLDSILELDLLRTASARHAPVDFDPEDVLTSAMESCEALAHTAGTTLVRLRSAASVTLSGEPDKLAQIFINLISNAIKYNDAPKPKVSVSSSSSGGVYEVRVEDNGRGIAKQDHERIFLKFERGPVVGHQGAGLGLSISRQITEQFGGKLFLDESGKSGACFILQVPISGREG
ncbi:MAG: sodium:solute symporter [Alphaproteobacteria bacterium]|nr:sodium:solute symporter [Alphaproteobacteria bacterium]MBU0796046.1 sodium:solute symporter [Alphaproteobacteria bacterium]MBU0886819.1 sodium:solute symporter [Alphaproteobacteria bacterium]MBU1812439.1 sodium:solute symporter [Alphaproteobacteria bacterium]MBU2091460.1 sodium:solute symporter [Alphaproteobacteria bacterium]